MVLYVKKDLKPREAFLHAGWSRNDWDGAGCLYARGEGHILSRRRKQTLEG